MVSLVLDVVVCAVLLGAGYLLFFNKSAQTATGTTSKSKKKRNRAKAKQEGSAGNEASALTNGKVEKEKSAAANGQKAEKRAAVATVKPEAPSKQPAKAKPSNGTPTPNDDFPPLSSSAAAASAAGSKPANNGISSQPKPLAERMGKKKQRKTAVDDMLESDDELRAPTYKQTMRIVKHQPEAPLIHDQDAEPEPTSPSSDGWEKPSKPDAWQTVAQKKPATIRIGSSTASTSSSPASYAPPRSVPGMTEPTKKQRQNAARAAAEKAAKDAAEQDRLQRLAAHKRGLERERMNAQAKEREKEKGKQKLTNRQNLSGGMQAKVENGALIWE